MGKKGTKRKTRWRALPLGGDDAGSGNEEELIDEDQSTTSSVVGQTTGYRVHPPMLRMGEKSYRPPKRFHYNRFRSNEPLIKLESKTFDEEEYTKITTPRQDVLFKKGYFGRKRESSVEETIPNAEEVEGEEPVMDQFIITNGFLDERGHYYVNGSSYEVYDPYSNTVTVVVGPPPYANGVSQPVLAAVSCQPVPLTPVEWYPPGSDWPSHGSAWMPSFSHGEVPSVAQNGDTSPSFNGCDGQTPSLYQQPAYVVPNYGYNENPNLNGDGTLYQDNPEISQSNGEPDLESKKQSGETNETNEKKELVIADMPTDRPTELNEKAARPVEKQNHSTQTGSEPENPIPLKVKESQSTQTIPEEALSAYEPPKTNSEAPKNRQDVKSPVTSMKRRESPWVSPRRDERKLGQRRANEKPKQEMRPLESNETSLKTSYAKKLLNGLEQSLNKEPKTVNGAKINGPSDQNNAQTAVMNVTVQSESNSIHSPTKTNYSNKRLSNDKFIPAEPRRGGSRIANGNVKNGFDRQRYNKANMGTSNRSKELRCRRSQNKWEEIVVNAPEDEVPATDSKNLSEKSSSVSELSSPTELSSGQNTPPEKLIVQKMEEKIENEFNRSFEEKLKQNLNEVEQQKVEEAEVEVEVQVQVQVQVQVEAEADAEAEAEAEDSEEATTTTATTKKSRKKGKKEERKTKTRAKRKKKQAEERKESDDFAENPFFQLCGKSQDFLSQAWESMNKDKVEPMPDLGSILTTNDDEILETLGIVQKWKVPKLPLASDLMLFPGFGRDHPKFMFEDFFASPSLRDLQADVFAKTNVANMRSTKPEEFFASVVDNPRKETVKSSKAGKKKGPGKRERAKEEKEEKKSEQPKEEVKLGIVEAVNTWLKEQGDPEKVLSVEALKRVEGDLPDQKNGPGNPIHAPSVEEGGACIRVANVSKDDGYLGTVTTEKRQGSPPRLYRSSSWDAKLSEIQIKKRLRFLKEASSWDRKWLKDSRLLKHFKFIADSATFCQDLLGDVRNGYEFAREELCDPKQSVSKYYTLSPSVLDCANDVDCEGEAFDALEYKFREVLTTGNLSITDSGVHSDTESNEETASELKHPLPSKEIGCKMQ